MKMQFKKKENENNIKKKLNDWKKQWKWKTEKRNNFHIIEIFDEEK